MVNTVEINQLSEVDLCSYQYAVIYNISDMYVGEARRYETLQEEQLIEGYFFDQDRELHIYWDEDALKLVEFKESDNGHLEHVDCSFELSKKVDGCDELIVREYLDYDEDGQSYIAFKRMIRME